MIGYMLVHIRQACRPSGYKPVGLVVASL